MKRRARRTIPCYLAEAFSDRRLQVLWFQLGFELFSLTSLESMVS